MYLIYIDYSMNLTNIFFVCKNDQIKYLLFAHDK